MSATRTLASYASKLNYEDLPPEAVERGKLQILDALGNAIGGYSLELSATFLDLAKMVGGGNAESTLIGDGGKVSVPLAAFGNGALTTILDYTAGRGALGVPAALAAGEVRDISGKEFIASVVAGYETVSRIIDSMSQTREQAYMLTGSTVSVFAATAAAGRALGLNELGMLSAFGMAGIYTPVPAGYKWLYDEDLLPRKDIKQGWAWMCMTGAFAAVSSQKGLRATQENNVLDGDKGLWRMLGNDVFHEEKITEGLGQKYHILGFASKAWPGCAVTHPAMVAATNLARDNGISSGDIEKVEVSTYRSYAVGFHDQEPKDLCDREFSIPYQVSAALVAGDKGPNWYSDSAPSSPAVADLAKRVTLSFLEDRPQALTDRSIRTTQVEFVTKAGQRYGGHFDGQVEARSPDELRNKFVTIASQAMDRSRADRVLGTIDGLESMGHVSELVDLLRIPAAR